MDRGVDPRKLAGLLADETRLRVVASIALGAGTLEDICTMSRLDNMAAARSLGQLVAGGLVGSDPASGYRVRTEVLREAARSDRREAARSDGLGGVVRNGRLPRSRADRLVALGRLVDLFEADRRYPEAEVNSRLKAVDADFALLRRSLVDEGLLSRTNEAGPAGRTVMVYWRTDRGQSPKNVP
jgi:hypothetical protein